MALYFGTFVVVQLQPTKQVTLLGGFAAFTCGVSFSTVVSVEWLVNGTSFNSHQLQNVEQTFVGIIGNLQFLNVFSDHNNTRIQCLASTSSDGVLPSEISILLVQGIKH